MTPLSLLVIFWLIGLWVAAQLPLTGLAWMAAAALAVVGAALAWRRAEWRWPAVCLVVAALAGARLAWARPAPDDPGNIAAYTGLGTLTVEGVVAGEVDLRQEEARLRVRVEALTLRGGEVIEPKGVLLIWAPRYSLGRQEAMGDPEFKYGDRVRVIGPLQAAPVFDSFDYAGYLAGRGVAALMPDAAVEFVEADQGNPLWAALLKVKARGLRVLAGSFPEPHASLLAGILLGVETGIPNDLEDAFEATGTSHIIAISGFNVAILAGLLGAATRRWLGPRRGLWLTLAGLALYTLLVGAGASVVRAALMAGLALLAGQVGRQGHALNGLAAAAWLMTVLNPLTLWDVGFQLSAAATLGLVLYADRLEAAFLRLAERIVPPGTARQATALVAELLLVTLAAQITTLPLIVYYFRQLSFISVAANALVVLAQPALMISGGVALLAGLVWPALGQVAAWLAWPFTAYTIAVVEALARVPGGVLYLGAVTPALVALYYAGLLALTARLDRPPAPSPAASRHPHRAPVGGLLLLGSAALVLWSWLLSLPPDDGRLRITVLDIGAPAEVRGGGEAVLLQTPGGAAVLIGGGPGDLTLARALDGTLPLFTRHLDLLVIASPSDQHLGSLPGTVRRYAVGRVVLTGAPGGSTAYRVLLDRLQDQQVEIFSAVGRPTLDLGGGLALRVLADGVLGSVLRLEWNRFSMIIAPRVDAEAEAELVDLGLAQPATALLLARSGSAAATSDAWLRAINPYVTLISAGAGQPGAAAPEVLARLAGRTVLRTDLHGDIRIETDGVQLWVTTEH